MLIKARWIYPVSSPPIENGAVVVEGDRMVYVGKAQTAPRHEPVLDLDDFTLLPGLVNAHCHLEFSHRPGAIPPSSSFAAWARQVMAWAERPKGPPEKAIQRMISTGTTTVADLSGPNQDFFETPFRRIVFWEVLGAEKGRAEESLRQAERKAETHGGLVTPHSLYAVHPSILGRVLSLRKSFVAGFASPKTSLAPPIPFISLHLLESADEDEYLRHGSGPLAELIQGIGGEAPITPLDYIHGPRPRTLIVHANYLTPSEIGALRDTHDAVIHCPGSHRFFGHRRFPYEALKEAGLTVALGTDSLASNEDLSMLREMRLFGENSSTSEEEILRMATLEGAKALGMEKEIGSLEVGKKADLIAVRGPIVEAESVIFSMIGGKVVLNDV